MTFSVSSHAGIKTSRSCSNGAGFSASRSFATEWRSILGESYVFEEDAVKVNTSLTAGRPSEAIISVLFFLCGSSQVCCCGRGSLLFLQGFSLPLSVALMNSAVYLHIAVLADRECNVSHKCDVLSGLQRCLHNHTFALQTLADNVSPSGGKFVGHHGPCRTRLRCC